ncbi:1-acyl-sn-glycerol-3-phosphate acyltransferase [Actinomadura sp. BRA 177]|uniref:1-acyl-sn-glycerol-3-phosphate acyltransferase n=1 Tax=Actinomadura sp. BRA 177 TaxID=2745202 RepID=UPI001595913F|nr:1-acyl-sn-glycerol-3-phosphate acyltransferase [Actinomadura sp. BRA 177]NVI90262.1 1-acyl-sn-glycerol-3-phosphate acyltransferase [Actinomadura sp. BRA 177]
MLPPPIVRRLVFTPLLFVLTLLVTVLFPVAFAVTSLIGRDRRRALRLLWFTLAWGLRESAAVLECGRLWIRRRAHDDRHYDIIRRYVAGLYEVAERRLGLRVEITGEGEAAPEDRPLIVLSRHAGPGDALLLVHHLLTDYRRRPRVVMKAQLQFDPCIDIAANRMPNVFVTPGGGAVDDIGLLAADLGPRDALLIFPEGGNFSPERRRRAIRRLTKLRRTDEATRAAAMRNLMPPRPGGVLAALDSAPSADVVFVAHCGLDHMATVGDIWRRIPLTGAVQAQWWRIPAEDVPDGRDARIDWLYQQWERADAWISANRAPASR